MKIIRKQNKVNRLTLSQDGDIRLKLCPDNTEHMDSDIIEFAEKISKKVGVPGNTLRGSFWVVGEKVLAIELYKEKQNWREDKYIYKFYSKYYEENHTNKRSAS